MFEIYRTSVPKMVSTTLLNQGTLHRLSKAATSSTQFCFRIPPRPSFFIRLYHHCAMR